MLEVNHLAGFGAIGSGPPITVVDDGASVNSTGTQTSTHTFTGKSSTGPWTLLCITHRNNNGRFIDSIDFDGQPARIPEQQYHTETPRSGAVIAILRGAFSSKTVTVGFSGAQDRSALTILSLDNLLGSQPLWTGFDQTVGVDTTVTLTGYVTSPGGILIGVFASTAEGSALQHAGWTTEHSDVSLGGMRHGVYSKLGNPTEDPAAGQGGGEPKTLVGAAFR